MQLDIIESLTIQPSVTPCIPDTPTHRLTIDELSLDQLDALLDEIRDRRLHIIATVEKQRLEKEESRLRAKHGQFEKLRIKLMDKCMKVGEMLDKLENEVNKLRALKLELE